MPEWAQPPPHLRAGAEDPERTGRIERVTAEPDDVTDEIRASWGQNFYADVWLPPGYDASDRRHPTVYVFPWSGVRNPEVGRWLDVLNRESGESFEAPIVIFLGGPAVMTRTLVQSIDERYRSRSDRASRAVVGWAFAAHPAIGSMLDLPDSIGRFAIQSYFGFVDDAEKVVADVGESVASGNGYSGYLEWGVLDTRSPSEGWDMRSSSRRVLEGLRELGVEVQGGEVLGTTDWKSWRNRTHVMLSTLFPRNAD
jgi:hypothetical protein